MSNERHRPRSLWVTIVVIMGAIGLSTVGIYASDMLRVPEEGMLASVLSSRKQGPCPEDMQFVDNERGGYCIDKYENSPGVRCHLDMIRGTVDTDTNISSPLCTPESVAAKVPWTYVAVHQAELLCSRVGKRLPTNQEWYRAAIGTPDDSARCAIARSGQDAPDKTGANTGCVSSNGVYDAVGNVWEWVSETVTEGRLSDTELPPDGFIREISDKGVPTRTSTGADLAFGGDYFFLDRNETKGIFRGGFWSMNERAGLYSMNITMSPSFQGGAVGFRCVKSANTPQK